MHKKLFQSDHSQFFLYQLIEIKRKRKTCWDWPSFNHLMCDQKNSEGLFDEIKKCTQRKSAKKSASRKNFFNTFFHIFTESESFAKSFAAGGKWLRRKKQLEKKLSRHMRMELNWERKRVWQKEQEKERKAKERKNT